VRADPATAAHALAAHAIVHLAARARARRIAAARAGRGAAAAEKRTVRGSMGVGVKRDDADSCKSSLLNSARAVSTSSSSDRDADNMVA
jgi:hypothetical protein